LRQFASAGKRRSARIKKGAPAPQRGPKKAAIAVAASNLETVYHMIEHGTCY
jgi:hypothetical protein